MKKATPLGTLEHSQFPSVAAFCSYHFRDQDGRTGNFLAATALCVLIFPGPLYSTAAAFQKVIVI